MPFCRVVCFKAPALCLKLLRPGLFVGLGRFNHYGGPSVDLFDSDLDSDSDSSLTMRVGIMGAGCIGQFVGAHLQCEPACVNVTYVGRSALARTEKAGLLQCSDLERPDFRIQLPVATCNFSYDTSALSSCDVVIVTLKCTDMASCKPLLNLRQGTVIISLQNGVENTTRCVHFPHYHKV